MIKHQEAATGLAQALNDTVLATQALKHTIRFLEQTITLLKHAVWAIQVLKQAKSSGVRNGVDMDKQTAVAYLPKGHEDD